MFFWKDCNILILISMYQNIVLGNWNFFYKFQVFYWNKKMWDFFDIFFFENEKSVRRKTKKFWENKKSVRWRVGRFSFLFIYRGEKKCETENQKLLRKWKKCEMENQKLFRKWKKCEMEGREVFFSFYI